MPLVHHNIEKLIEVRELLIQISSDLYTKPLSILDGSTIGGHVRHILEFVDCVRKGSENGIISFDDRERSILIETNREIAKQSIEDLIIYLGSIKEDGDLLLKANYSSESDDSMFISTSLYRELAYTLDHTVHHLAIVKIALSQEELDFELGSGFGVAPSTIRFRKELQTN